MADKEKYIGLVKWFHDQARNANYGFIQHAKLGDLFFHERSIEKGQDINSFRENAIVVFIAQESKKHKGKLEAIGVKYLDNETDLKFLFNHFLSIMTEKGKYSDYNTIQKGVHSKITSLLEKSTDKKIIELFEGFQKYVNEQIKSNSITDEEYLKSLLKVGKGFFPNNYGQISDIVEKNISVELAYKLWLDSFIDSCQIDYIASIILSTPEQTLQKIFKRCSEADKTNIFFQVLYNVDKIDTEAKLKMIKQLLDISKKFASEKYEKIIAETIKNCPDYFKLSLWLEDYHETLDFQIYKLYTITLSPKDQKRFVKKVLKYIHEEKVNISLEDLTSLNVMDFETSKLAEQIDSSKLDFSTSIILNVISELNAQTNLETRKDITSAQHRIYDLIKRQIKQPKDILQISGFFDECEGRCGVSVHEEKNEAGEIINRTVSYNRNEHNKAKNHPICDGRKAWMSPDLWTCGFYAYAPNTVANVVRDHTTGDANWDGKMYCSTIAPIVKLDGCGLYKNQLQVVFVELLTDDQNEVNYHYISDICVDVNDTIVSKENIKNVKYFNIYPNPNNGIFRLDVKLDKTDNINIQIFDIMNKEIYNKNFKNMSELLETINLSEYSNGIYILQLTTSDTLVKEKMLIQK